MKFRVEMLDRLCCPVCRGVLAIEANGDGVLSCAGGHHYPIRDGVPNLYPSTNLTQDHSRTAAAFESRWSRFYPEGGYMSSAELFLDYVHPVTVADFAGKTVLDAGCGTGRFARLARSLGAATVYGLDVSGAVRLRRGRPPAEEGWYGVEADIQTPPFAKPFDWIFCLGVLHHLPDPAGGFAALAALLAPGGRFSIWVYGRENNGWLLSFIDPLRRAVTSRLSPFILHRLCLPPALILRLLARSPLLRHVLRLLPGGGALAAYCEGFLARLNFEELVGVVYDHLIPPTAHYLSRAEVESWFAAAGLDLIAVEHRFGNSWRALGVKPISRAN